MSCDQLDPGLQTRWASRKTAPVLRLANVANLADVFCKPYIQTNVCAYLLGNASLCVLLNFKLDRLGRLATRSTGAACELANLAAPRRQGRLVGPSQRNPQASGPPTCPPAEAKKSPLLRAVAQLRDLRSASARLEPLADAFSSARNPAPVVTVASQPRSAAHWCNGGAIRAAVGTPFLDGLCRTQQRGNRGGSRRGGKAHPTPPVFSGGIGTPTMWDEARPRIAVTQLEESSRRITP
jgi:hypothetical protein